jgi:hypothetical protein
MSKKTRMKSCKNLDRSARQAGRNASIRLHKIKNARENHLKNAIRSCGVEFAEKLKAYYSQHPVSSVGKRMGNHLGSE